MSLKALTILLALFVLLMPIIFTDHAAPLPAPAATAEVTPEPVAEATPEATEQTTAEATDEITPEATAEGTAVALAGDPAHGDILFHQGAVPAPACINCHSTANTGKQGFALGPGLKGIATIAATRVEGMTAEQYIEASIRHPNDFLAPGFRGIMYPNFGTDYNDQNIADLVVYLMTL